MTDPIAHFEPAPSEPTSTFSSLEFACERVFLTVLSISAGTSGLNLDPQSLKRQMFSLLDGVSESAAQDGEDAETINMARYALIAFADETIASRLSEWNSVLALEAFQDNRAGEGFFEHAHNILREGTRPHLARIYTMCLAFGFRGQYAVRNTEGLEDIQKKLADFGDNGQVDLASLAKVPPQAYRRASAGLSPTWYAGIFACFAIVFAITLSLRLDERSAQAIDWLNRQTPRNAASSQTSPKTTPTVAPASVATPDQGPQ